MINQHTPEQLAAKATQGDESAKAILYYDYVERVANYVRPKLTSEVRAAVGAEDVAADVLLKAFTALHRFEDRGRDSFEKWLFMIAKRHTLDVIAKGGKNKPTRVTKPANRSSTLGTVLGILPGHEKSPTSILKKADLERALDAAIAGLSEGQRKVILLRFVEELSWEEVARRADGTVEGVRSLARRALDNLRESLGNLSRYISRC